MIAASLVMLTMSAAMPSPTAICDKEKFDIDTSGFMVNNLFDAHINDIATCRQTCCDGSSSDYCAVWQFQLSTSMCQLGNPDPSGGRPWVFQQSADWVGGARSTKGATKPEFPAPTTPEAFSGFSAGSCTDSPAGVVECGYLPADRCQECCASFSKLGCCVHDNDDSTIKSVCHFYENSTKQAGSPTQTSGVFGAGGGGGSSGCSGGCVFIILFFTLPIAYLAGGALYNYKQKELRGIEMVPNLEFWKDLPKLIKDGMVFFWQGLRRLFAKATGGTYSPV